MLFACSNAIGVRDCRPCEDGNGESGEMHGFLLPERATTQRISPAG
jgi:hypothetical protein